MIVRLLLLALAFPVTLFAGSYGDFDVSRQPEWVERVPVDMAVAIPPNSARFGLYDLLSDHQVQVARGTTSHFYRTVRKVLSTSGVQNASELSLDFDPSYQRLVLHEVVVIRAGRRHNALVPEEVRVIEKEDDADSRVYDGRFTALVFLKDVRVGDTLDYSWTVDGANPILRGRFADVFDISSSVPASVLRHRLLLPPGRELRYRTNATISPPASTKWRNQQVFVWVRRDVEALQVEDRLPDWYDPWQRIEVSEFASWAEVARWAVRMFEADPISLAAVHEIGNTIRSQNASDAERVTAAIRFVQDEIRYLGVEIGRNSHQPRPPAAVLDQRWGDCKEKALLLSLLLRDLGLTADPALVSTESRDTLDQRLPSPFAFDHVIVRVQNHRRTYWIDPTIAEQGGTLETIETPNDGRALVVALDATSLTRIDTVRRGKTDIDEHFISRDASSATVLEVRTTYTGSDADALRLDLTGISVADLAREHLNHYAADHPEIVALEAPSIEDERKLNSIVVKERYTIRNLWKGGAWTYYPRYIEQYLDRPETVIRAMPLAFDYPLDITQRATFSFPGRVRPLHHVASFRAPAFRFQSTSDGKGRAIVFEYSLVATRDTIMPRAIPRHLTVINRIADEIGSEVKPSFPAARHSAGEDARQTHRLIVAAAVTGGICSLIAAWLLLRAFLRSGRRTLASQE